MSKIKIQNMSITLNFCNPSFTITIGCQPYLSWFYQIYNEVHNQIKSMNAITTELGTYILYLQ